MQQIKSRDFIFEDSGTKMRQNRSPLSDFKNSVTSGSLIQLYDDKIYLRLELGG